MVDDGFTAREAKFNTETIPFIWGGATQVAILANHYEQESGEKWTTKDTERLFGIMNADKNFDALAVEEKFLAPVRDKKKADAEVEERANKRAEEILKERGVSSGMPGGGGERTIPSLHRKTQWDFCKGDVRKCGIRDYRMSATV